MRARAIAKREPEFFPVDGSTSSGVVVAVLPAMVVEVALGVTAVDVVVPRASVVVLRTATVVVVILVVLVVALTVVVVAAAVTHLLLMMVLVSSVTAPLRASNYPKIFAPVVAVMLVRAITLAMKVELTPNVAELPTLQKTLQA